jgi:hypothetical protein
MEDRVTKEKVGQNLPSSLYLSGRWDEYFRPTFLKIQ